MFLINPHTFITSTYLVELYSPYVAYDLRKISITSTNCIRVRRSSDSTELDIGFSGDDLDESALTTFGSGTDCFVTTWYDQSGNGFDVVNTTAANQPRIVSGGTIDTVNSKPAILSDGTNDGLKVTGLTGVRPNTHFYVYDKVSTTGHFGAFNAGHSLAPASVLGATGMKAYQNGSAFTPYTTLNTQALIVLKSTDASSIDWTLHENNSVITNSGEIIGDLTFDRVSLFDRSNNTLRTSIYLQCYYIFNTDETANRVAIQDDINTYYSVY